MAGSVATVFAEVVPEMGGFASKVTAELSKATSGIKSGASKLGATLGIALGAGAIAILKHASDAFVQLGGEVKSFQRVTGASAEEASKLIFVGHELGVEAAAMNQSFGLLAKNIANNTANFTKYGLATTDAQGNQLSLNTILGEAADKYVAMGGGLKGAAFAMNVFGRGGKTLLPILAKGSAGIAAMGEEAERLGVVLSEDDVTAARALVIAQRQLGEAFKGLSVSVGREVTPVLTALVGDIQVVVEAIGKIPTPVKVGVLAFAALTGAMLAVVKVGGLLSSIWGPIGRALVGAAVSAYGYVAALVSLAISEGVAATASLAFGAAIDVALGPVGILVGALGLLAGGFLWARASAKESAAEIHELTLSLVKGSTSLKGFNTQLAKAQALGQVKGVDGLIATAEAAGLAIKAMQLAAASGISYSEALQIVQVRAGLTALTIEELNSVTAAFDPTALLAESPQALAAITGFADRSSGALADFARISGQSIDTIKGDLLKLVTDAKATAGDVIKTITDMKAAWQAWHDSLVDNFGGAAGALSKFVGKNNVDFDKLKGSLQSYMTKLASFRTDFRELAKDPSSKQFLQAASEGGIEWLGIMDSVAEKSPKARQKFYELFNGANRDTQSLASVIQNKLVPKFDTMIDRLTSIANSLGANYKIDVDTGPALAKLQALQTQIRNTFATLPGAHSDTSGGGATHGGQHHPPVTEHGGYFPGAARGGYVNRDQLIRVGEKGKAEMILPLKDRAGIDALTIALGRALERAGGGGSSGVLHIDNFNTGRAVFEQREVWASDHRGW